MSGALSALLSFSLSQGPWRKLRMLNQLPQNRRKPVKYMKHIHWFSAYDGLWWLKKWIYARTIHAVPHKYLQCSHKWQTLFASEGACHLDSALVDAWRQAIFLQCHEVEHQKPASCGFFHGFFHGQAWFTRPKMPRTCHFWPWNMKTIHQPWLGSILSIIPYRARPFSWALPCFTSSLNLIDSLHLIVPAPKSSKIPSPGRSGKILKDDDAFVYPAQQNMIKHVSSCLPMSPKTEAPRTRKALANAKRWFSSCTCTSSQ